MRTLEKVFEASTDFSASGTGFGSQVRIDFDSSYSFLDCFVTDKSLQLEEVPSVQPEIKTSSFVPSYSFDVFHHDIISCPATVNYCSTDIVVCPSLETSLPSTQLLKKSFRASGAFSLKLTPQPFELDHTRLNLAPAEKLLITCYSNMVYSDVNTYNFSIRSTRVNVSGKSDVDEKSFFSFDYLGCLRTPIKILPIIFRNFNRNIHPTINCCNPYLIGRKTESSLVKRQGKKLFKNRFTSFISFNTFKSLTSNPVSIYDQLGRKPKLFFHIVIAKVMKIIPIKHLGFEAFITNITNSSRILSHRLKNFLFLPDLKFYRRKTFHNKNKNEFSFINFLHTLVALSNTLCKISDGEKEFPKHFQHTTHKISGGERVTDAEHRGIKPIMK